MSSVVECKTTAWRLH